MRQETKDTYYTYRTKRICVLIASLLLTIVCILILLLFCGRVFAQRAANQAHITANYIDITKVPINDTLFQVQISAHAEYHAPFQVAITQANVRVFYQRRPLASIKAFNIVLQRGSHSQDILINASADVTDIAVLSEMSAQMFASKTLTIECEAELIVAVFGMRYSNIQLRQALTVRGMQQFQNPPPEIHSIQLESCSSDDIALTIDATIDNVSQLGFQDKVALNMSVYYEQDYLGYALSHSNLSRNRSRQLFTIHSPFSFQSSVLKKMINGIMSQKAVFQMRGDNPYVSESRVLRSAFQSLALKVIYTDGLSKIHVSQNCDLSAVIQSAVK